jgi:hypothetical protein
VGEKTLSAAVFGDPAICFGSLLHAVQAKIQPSQVKARGESVCIHTNASYATNLMTVHFVASLSILLAILRHSLRVNHSLTHWEIILSWCLLPPSFLHASQCLNPSHLMCISQRIRVCKASFPNYAKAQQTPEKRRH